VTSASALTRVRWRHPEAGAAGVALLSWALVLLPVWDAGSVSAMHHVGQLVPDEAHAHGSLLLVAAGWLAMTTAMMLPGALPAARHLALGALWSRRQQTVGIFLGVYLGVWATFGALAYTMRWAVESALAVEAAALLPAALAAAAVWQMTPPKWHAVRACHVLPPLPPRGVKADVACAAVALRYGRRCVVSCWPSMLAMAAAGHDHLALMVLLAGIVFAEKVAARPGRLALPTAVVLAGAAAISVWTGPAAG